MAIDKLVRVDVPPAWAPDPDPRILSLELDGLPPVTLTISEARNLITMALTIPSLEERIRILELDGSRL